MCIESKDSNGQYVTVDKTKDINFLNFGHYTAEIFTYDRTELKFVSSLTQEFDLTEDNSFQTIAFLANTLEYAPVSISFDQPVSKAATIVLKGQMVKTLSCLLKNMVKMALVNL